MASSGHWRRNANGAVWNLPTSALRLVFVLSSCVFIEVVFVSLSEARLAEAPDFVQLCVIHGASILGDQTDSVSRCLMAAVKKALKVFEELQYAHGDPVRRRSIAATLA